MPSTYATKDILAPYLNARLQGKQTLLNARVQQRANQTAAADKVYNRKVELLKAGFEGDQVNAAATTGDLSGLKKKTSVEELKYQRELENHAKVTALLSDPAAIKAFGKDPVKWQTAISRVTGVGADKIPELLAKNDALRVRQQIAAMDAQFKRNAMNLFNSPEYAQAYAENKIHMEKVQSQINQTDAVLKTWDDLTKRSELGLEDKYNQAQIDSLRSFRNTLETDTLSALSSKDQALAKKMNFQGVQAGLIAAGQIPFDPNSASEFLHEWEQDPNK